MGGLEQKLVLNGEDKTRILNEIDKLRWSKKYKDILYDARFGGGSVGGVKMQVAVREARLNMPNDEFARFLKSYVERCPLLNDKYASIDEVLEELKNFVLSMNFDPLPFLVGETHTSLTEVLSCICLSVPGYQVLSQLGEGASAKVYLVKSEKAGLQNTRYALKVFNKGVVNEREFSNFDRLSAVPAQYRSHFLQIQPVARVMYAGNEVTAFMMPFGGQRLREIMSEKKLNPWSVLYIATQLNMIVGAMRAIGEVHGDVNPNNLFVDEEGWVTIGDYGIVEPTGEFTRTSNRRYGAPATYKGASPNHFSVALMIYEMVAGEHLILPRERDASTAEYAVSVRERIEQFYTVKGKMRAEYVHKIKRVFSPLMIAEDQVEWQEDLGFNVYRKLEAMLMEMLQPGRAHESLLRSWSSNFLMMQGAEKSDFAVRGMNKDE